MPEKPEDINYFKEAFGWQYNLIGLAGAAGFALISGTALPLILAAGVELMYLSLVPNNSRFQRLIRSRKYADEREQQSVSLNRLIGELNGDDRNRYAGFGAACRGVRENYRRLSSSSQMIVQQLEQKLEALQHSFLRLLHSAQVHREYVRTFDPVSIDREIAYLKKNLERDPEKVRPINEQRIEIMTRRLEKFQKIRDNSRVLDAQLRAMEDVLALMRDQSVTMRDPQELTVHLDGLIQNVESTENTVREMESIMELTAVDSGGGLGSQSGSGRVRN